MGRKTEATTKPQAQAPRFEALLMTFAKIETTIEVEASDKDSAWDKASALIAEDTGLDVELRKKLLDEMHHKGVVKGSVVLMVYDKRQAALPLDMPERAPSEVASAVLESAVGSEPPKRKRGRPRKEDARA